MNEKKNGSSECPNMRRRFRPLLFKVCIGVLLITSSLVTLTGMHSKSSMQSQNGVDQKKNERFDNLVRADFFAGMDGDKAAFDRAMKLCADTLAKNPKHAGAMVWQGAGLVHLASLAFEKGDNNKGGELWERGLKEMDDAVNLEPKSLEVLIPRGATLLEASRSLPFPSQARALLEKGVNDYEMVLELQQPYFDKLSVHARAELLFGLGEGWYRLANKEKAHIYLSRVVKECQGSGLEDQAKRMLNESKLPMMQKTQSCVGCHA